MDILQKWFPFNHKEIKAENEKTSALDNSEEQTQIFCFHSAGSSASLYRNWREATKNNSDITFIPVEIPGRGNHITSPPAAYIDDLVEGFIAVLLKVVRPPYVLYGHSFGAVVAFQIAYALHQKGIELPEKLIVAGRHAPHMKDPSPLNSVSTDEDMINEIKKMGGTPEVILNHPEMLKFALSQLRGDLRTHESFKYTGQKLKIPIEAHCGKQDDANKMVMEYWKDVTDGAFSINEFEGHHFFIQSLGDIYLESLIQTIYKTKKTFS